MTDTFTHPTTNRTYKKEAQAVEITGTLYFTKIHRPDPGTKKIAASHSVGVIPDNEGDRALLKFLDVTMKPPTDAIPEEYILPRVYVDKITEGRHRKPVIVDADKQPLTAAVGNGSKGRVLFYAIPEQYGIVNVVQVTDLIEYEGKGTGSDLAGLQFDDTPTETDDEMGVASAPDPDDTDAFLKDMAG